MVPEDDNFLWVTDVHLYLLRAMYRDSVTFLPLWERFMDPLLVSVLPCGGFSGA